MPAHSPPLLDGPMRFLLLACLAASACARPDHIEIDPRAPRLTHRGEAVRMHARLRDRSGQDFSRERATWTTRDPFVAGVDANGAVTALSSGHTIATATWNELHADVPVDVDLVEALRVDPPSLELASSADPVALGVTAIGLDGRPLRDREVHLTSANPAVARVDTEGRVWPVAPGDAVVHAKIDDKESEIAVHVRK